MLIPMEVGDALDLLQRLKRKHLLTTKDRSKVERLETVLSAYCSFDELTLEQLNYRDQVIKETYELYTELTGKYRKIEEGLHRTASEPWFKWRYLFLGLLVLVVGLLSGCDYYGDSVYTKEQLIERNCKPTGEFIISKEATGMVRTVVIETDTKYYIYDCDMSGRKLSKVLIQRN